MITCTGKSLIPISFDAYQKFMSSVIPPQKLPDFNIKLDARSNVKSTFAKLKGIDLTLYTGAMINYGLSKFPNILDVESLLMLFTLYGVKKAGMGVDFEAKTTDAGIAELKCDTDFQFLLEKLPLFMAKFIPLNKQALASVSFSVNVVQEASVDSSSVGSPLSESALVETEKSAPKTRATNVSPYKNVPLSDTPKISVPADLDLRTV